GAWHTDFELVGGRAPVTATLLRDDGTVASSAFGYSQFYQSDKTPKLNFAFDVFTLEDVARLATHAPWTLRIKNEDILRILNFRMGTLKDAPSDPANEGVDFFMLSTFTLRCFDVGSFTFAPTESAVAVHERVNYAFTWTVPAPRSWHDLDWLQVRIR